MNENVHLERCFKASFLAQFWGHTGGKTDRKMVFGGKMGAKKKRLEMEKILSKCILVG